jgi:hypothetical protein
MGGAVLLELDDVRLEYFDIHTERYFRIVTPYDVRKIHSTVFARKLKEMLDD